MSLKISKLIAIEGSLLGFMAGDSLGLPYEGLSSTRVNRFLKGELEQCLVLRCGMISDDTEHAVMTTAALAGHYDDCAGFQKNLAWRLRWWFLRLPAGMGLATGRAIIKLWLGFPASKSGVYSAGNGPAMRAPVLGVAYGDQPEKMKAYVKASTENTHTDPKATIGSLAVAQAAYMSSTQVDLSIKKFRYAMVQLLEDEETESVEEFLSLLDMLEEALTTKRGIEVLLKQLKLEKGVTGYIYHTVPVVLYYWLKYPVDIKVALYEVISLGGDTDTTAAILGGIIGAGLTAQEIPEEWIERLIDWPITPAYISRVAHQLDLSITDSGKPKIDYLPGPLIFVRNMVFLMIVLLHGFRRLLPPY